MDTLNIAVAVFAVASSIIIVLFAWKDIKKTLKSPKNIIVTEDYIDRLSSEIKHLQGKLDNSEVELTQLKNSLTVKDFDRKMRRLHNLSKMRSNNPNSINSKMALLHDKNIEEGKSHEEQHNVALGH